MMVIPIKLEDTNEVVYFNTGNTGIQIIYLESGQRVFAKLEKNIFTVRSSNKQVYEELNFDVTKQEPRVLKVLKDKSLIEEMLTEK